MIEVERERRRWNMGVYLNPGNEKFAKAVQSEIYVDKTGLIEYTNQVINTVQRYVCVSRPRRFGKSMTADMLTAYYGKECDSRELFSGLKISQNAVFAQHLNQYPTIFLNMQEFLSRSKEIGQVIDRVRRMLLRELKNSYPDVDYFDDTDLVESLQDIYAATKQSFVIIIDEWDCVFREYQQDKKAQEEYLDFLRDFLKDKVYVALAYLTGILPIKKYGTHSADQKARPVLRRISGALRHRYGHFSQRDHGAHRPLGLRQVHISQNAQPHERSRAGLQN